MELDLPKIIIWIVIGFLLYKTFSSPAVVDCLQWTWRFIMVGGFVLALALGGFTGEEIIPILGFLAGEGMFGAIKATIAKKKVIDVKAED